MYCTSLQDRLFILVIDGTNHVRYLFHRFQFIYKPIPKTVHPKNSKKSCPVYCDTILQSTCLQLITHPYTPPHCSEIYVFCFTKICFREDRLSLFTRKDSRSPASTEKITAQRRMSFTSTNIYLAYLLRFSISCLVWFFALASSVY